MNAEIISYRCSRTEWETVRMLLSLNAPIGLPEIPMDEAECNAAYLSLCDSGLLIPSGDSVIVDRLLAFLVTEASQADMALVLRNPGRQLLLHRTPNLSLISEWTPRHCELTPFPVPAAARDALWTAFRRFNAPMELELLLPQGVVRAETLDTPELALSALERTFNEFCAHSLNSREA